MIDASLRAAGISTFLDERDIKVGDPITEKIYEGIASATDLLYIISENSIISSWAQEELEVAKVRQKREAGFGILPVLIDNTSLPASLTNVRYADMQNWQDANRYRIAMLDLLRALSVTPSLIDSRQLQWWIQNHAALTMPREKIVACHETADIMIGYYHYFNFGVNEPYRWAWNWIYRELEIRSYLEQMLDLLNPALHLGTRFEMVHSAVSDLLEEIKSMEPHPPFESERAETAMRSILIATGRITGLIAELEGQALTAVFSIVDM
jgi:hypothetical protein